MKIKKPNLEFYVFNLTYDDKVYRCNILDNEKLIEEIAKSYKNGKLKTFEDVRKKLRTYFMSRYWSRCEYEYMVSGLFENMPQVMERENRKAFKGYKLDAFYQIELNLNTITQIVISNMELDIEIPKVYPIDTEFWDKTPCKELETF